MMKDKLLNVIESNDMSFAWVMLYFYDQVVMGKYENNQLVLMNEDYDETLCYQVHIFNKDKELRSSNDFDFIEIKSPKDSAFYMEEKFYVLGNKTLVEEGCTTFTQYGRKIKLPVVVQTQGVNHNTRLVVHHLFDEKTGYLKGYRLVDIEGGK